jgi:uncharacterized protein
MTPGKAMQILFTIVMLVLVSRWYVGRLFYYPDRVSYGTPERIGLKFEEVTFTSGDGTMLSGWFVPAIGKPLGTVIHFHGNAENMTSHFGFVDWLPAKGFNVFVFDYRGYGKSAGRPNRRGVYEDSVAAIRYVQARPDVDRDRILILGQSLGGANAIVALGNNSFSGIRGVAIESTFSSHRAMVRDIIGTMPLLSIFKRPLATILMDDTYSPADAIARIAPVPVLLIHGTADGVVPYRQGTDLYDRAGEPKEFWSIKGGEHTDAFMDDDSPYRQRLVTFYLSAMANTKGTPPPVPGERP